MKLVIVSIIFIIIGIIFSKLAKLVGSEVFKLSEIFTEIFKLLRKLFRKSGDIIKKIIR